MVSALLQVVLTKLADHRTMLLVSQQPTHQNVSVNFPF